MSATLDAGRFRLAEHERNVHVICVEQGITRKDIANPAFLAHVAAKLRPYDQIEVRCDDGSFFGRLLVLQADRTWAKTHCLEWHDLTTRDVAQTQTANEEKDPSLEFAPTYKGPNKKWCVIRQSDQAIVREGEDTTAAAEHWLSEYRKVTA